MNSQTDDEEFSVFLSRQDYENLKRCRENYDSLKADLQNRIAACDESKQNINQRLQTVMLENGRLRNQKEDLDIWIKRIQSIVKERHSKLVETYEKQLPKLSDKAFLNKHKPEVELPENLSKLVDIEAFINQIFQIFSEALRIQNEKVGNLVRQSMTLKQQNLALKQSLTDKSEELRFTKKETQNKLGHLMMQVDKLQLQKKELEEAKNKFASEGAQIIDEQHKQISSLRAQLSHQSLTVQSLQKELQISQQKSSHYQKQSHDLQQQIKQYQQHISILKQSIKLQSRLKEANRKTIPKSTKFEKEDFIKETLVEYMRDIRKNLISIGNLSQEEIRQIGASELRTLGKFIQELEEDFQ